MLRTYLADEVAEIQALLMHGRIVQKHDAHSSVQVLTRHLAALDGQNEPVPAADSEEAMRAQAAAEQMLGPPANAG